VKNIHRWTKFVYVYKIIELRRSITKRIL